jgi:hypothetical protein
VHWIARSRLRSVIRTIAFSVMPLVLGAECLAQQHAMTVRFDGSKLMIGGLTPGGRAVAFGVGLQPQGDYSQVVRRSHVSEAAGVDGAITIDLGDAASPMTIWCIADATTAKYLIVSPRGDSIPFVPLPKSFLRKGAKGAVTQFSFDHMVIDALYLEPGRGAWTCSDTDGSSTDQDGANGLTTVDVGRCRSILASNDAPSELRPGGVLVAIDFYRMEVLATRLDTDAIGRAR